LDGLFLEIIMVETQVMPGMAEKGHPMDATLLPLHFP
jgi:hypothetical protein